MANEVTLTGYVNNVKSVSDNLATFGLGMRVKQQDGSYKSAWVNCKFNPTKVDLKEGDLVTVKGFITFDFWKSEGSDKEQQRLYIFVQEAKKEEKE